LFQPMKSRFITLLLLLLTATALAQSPLELQVFRDTNAARKRHGLSALKWNYSAYRAARDYARKMLRQGFFGHVSPDGSTPGQRMLAAGVYQYEVGENLAYYGNYSAKAAAAKVVQDWMNSPHHRENILRPEFNLVGIAIARDKNLTYIVQEFISSPYDLWLWQSKARGRAAVLAIDGKSNESIGIFVNGLFVAAYDPPAWRLTLYPRDGDEIAIALRQGNRYLRECSFTLPDSTCKSSRLRLNAYYEHLAMEICRVRLALPPGEYFLAGGESPRVFEKISGDAVVELPLVEKYLWLGSYKSGVIEYQYRIPLCAAP